MRAHAAGIFAIATSVKKSEVINVNTNVRFLLFILLLGSVFVAGLGAGIYSKRAGELFDSPDRRLGVHEGFTNPLLDCAERIGLASSGSLTLDHIANRIRQYERQVITDSKRQQISVYLRDLNNGPWVGINENELLKPGSLLKVPLAVGYMRHSEEEAGFLDRKVVYSESALEKLYDIQGVMPTNRLKVGESYTLKDLIERILIYSDNVAAVLLESYDQHRSMIQTSKDIDLPMRAGIPPLRNLTIKEYAAVFRILYNASYLSRTNSEYLLGLLAKSEFRHGLVAGIGNDIKVSHKFGESIDAVTKQKFFHDCGIVYYPAKPYLLCIATRGDDPAEMVTWIQEISRIVFEGNK